MKRTTVDTLTARQTALDESLSRERLDAWQLGRLNATLRHVSASSFYRRHLAGIAPLNSLADLRHLPFLTASDLRREGLNLQCLSQSEIARIITLNTSGSTGAAKRIAFTAGELEATREFFREGMENLLSPEDRVLVLLPADRPDSTGDLLRNCLPEKGHPTFIHWPPGTPQQLAAAVEAHDANCVIGLPQHLLSLAEALGEKHPVRTVLLNSDYAPPALRQRIEARGITTFLHYGATETGLGGGVECDHHHGCHLREADILLEIIDPQTGTPLAEGETGEIVLTTLRRRAMPLIRYRTGDSGALNRQPCPCGGITTRLLDIHRHQGCDTPQGFLASRQLDDLLFTLPGLLDYRAALAPEGLHLEYLAVEEIPPPHFPLPSGITLASAKRAAGWTPKHTFKRILRDLR